MDKIRFTLGTNHVFQGFDDGSMGMAGPQVLVTADTLRVIVDHMVAETLTTDFDREHNAPESEMGQLSFGDGEVVAAPNGLTPLYRIETWFATIVQRYDPEKALHSGWKGVWVNEDGVYDNTGMPESPDPLVCHGFVISPSNVADGRGDAPLIWLEKPEPEPDGKEYVVDVFVPVAVTIRADNAEMAADIAKEMAVEQGVVKRIHEMVDQDWESSFTISDSDLMTEVGLD